MPTVEFARTVQIDATPEEAWETLTDIHKLAEWVTVLGNLTEIEHLSRYRATLTDRVGPFQLSADLDVEVLELEPTELITFVADGEDRQVASRILIEAGLRLRDVGSGTSVLVQGKYEVTGRVATLGASMIRAKGEKILEQFVSATKNAFG